MKEKKINSKKKFIKFLLLGVMLIGMTLPTQKVCAAKKPFDDLPKKITFYDSLPMEKGCDYLTPFYKSKVKLTAKSTNKKVAKVKVYNFEYLSREGKKEYYSGYELNWKKNGSTTIKLKAKVGKKTYTKNVKYTKLPYKNPFSSFKIGKKQYAKIFNKNYMANAEKIDGKMSYKLKKGYKVTRITAYYERDGSYLNKKVKNNKSLPSNTTMVIIETKNIKNKLPIYMSIDLDN